LIRIATQSAIDRTAPHAAGAASVVVI